MLLYKITTTTTIITTITTLFITPAPIFIIIIFSLPSPAQYYTNLQNASTINTLARQFSHINLVQQGTLLGYCYKVITYTYLIEGLYNKVQPMAYDCCTANSLTYRIYYMAFYSQKTLRY